MSDVQKRKRQLKKQLKEAKKNQRKAELEHKRVQRQVIAEDKKVDQLTREIDARINDWDADPEVGDLISILTSTNFREYIKGSAAIQKVVKGYFERTQPFGPDGKIPIDKKVKVLRELPAALDEAFGEYGIDLWTKVKNALIESGRVEDSIDEQAVMKAASIIIAREAIKDETSKRILEKNPQATAGIAREAIDSFMTAHYRGLSGKALEAKQYVDQLTPKLRKQIKESLEKHPSKNGFKELEIDVRRQLLMKYPEPLDPGDRTLAFERMFEIVDRTMELANMLEDEHPEEEPELKKNARQAIVFFTAEKIFFKEQDAAWKKEEEPEPPEPTKDEWHIPSTNLWSDTEITSLGRSIWERSYKLGLGDDEASRVARQATEWWAEQASENGVLVNDQRKHIVETLGLFAGKWAVHAFQRITTTHTYAAALMCSDADKEVLEDIEMQWHAFMVIIPNGLLSYEEDGIVNEYNRILVAAFDGAATIALLNQHGSKSSHRIIVQMSETIAKILDVEDVKMVHATDPEFLQDQKKVKVQRVIVLAKRMVAGLLLALQHQNNFKSKTTPARASRNPREPGEPAHRVVFVGKPLKVDCRPSIGDYIRNGSPKRKGAPPSVQFIVRGHYKRQVIGVGRLGRKVIWIEPFWKGSIDAPILTRPKKIEGT